MTCLIGYSGFNGFNSLGVDTHTHTQTNKQTNMHIDLHMKQLQETRLAPGLKIRSSFNCFGGHGYRITCWGLREILQLVHRGPRSQVKRQP